MFPLFYQEVLTGWSKYSSSPISITSTMTSQFLWFNKYIKIDAKCIYFEEFSINGKKPIKEEKVNLITQSIYDNHLIKKNHFFQ